AADLCGVGDEARDFAVGRALSSLLAQNFRRVAYDLTEQIYRLGNRPLSAGSYVDRFSLGFLAEGQCNQASGRVADEVEIACRIECSDSERAAPRDQLAGD